ncbi:MAG: hypothetical protein ACR5K7_03265 [Symbiopectobacterium sp.]
MLLAVAVSTITGKGRTSGGDGDTPVANRLSWRSVLSVKALPPSARQNAGK